MSTRPRTTEFPPCYMIARRLDKYGVKTEVPNVVVQPDDCLLDFWGSGSMPASVRFSRGRLAESDIPTDIPYEDPRATKAGLKKKLAKIAESCSVYDIHEHEDDTGVRTEWHVHLSGCTVSDLGKALKELGYSDELS